ncbi:MAG: fumarate hydratase [Ruminococcaceae bacterium]|nr:fumarate hydratase [Oscillospiraceae bacterium]
MKTILATDITKTVRQMCIDANTILPDDAYQSICSACKTETSPVGKNILEKLVVNADIAKEERIPICQDTGYAVFFVEVGQEVYVEGNLTDAINEGVRQGYVDGYLRKSVVADPLDRVNTQDNTPAIIHYDIVPGDAMKITFAPKGFGSENMSKIAMLPPSAGYDGVVNVVLDAVRSAGPNPCPPIVVGVCVGGDFEQAAKLSKVALTQPIGTVPQKPLYQKMQKELMEKINSTDIGPAGLGGKNTALWVNIIDHPTHIAGMPVAVNICCHVSRHITKVL